MVAKPRKYILHLIKWPNEPFFQKPSDTYPLGCVFLKGLDDPKLEEYYLKYNLGDSEDGFVQLINDHIKTPYIKRVNDYYGYPEFEIKINNERYYISFNEDLTGAIRRLE
jgi:hypothetical protein